MQACADVEMDRKGTYLVTGAAKKAEVRVFWEEATPARCK